MSVSLRKLSGMNSAYFLHIVNLSSVVCLAVPYSSTLSLFSENFVEDKMFVAVLSATQFET